MPVLLKIGFVIALATVFVLARPEFVSSSRVDRDDVIKVHEIVLAWNGERPPHPIFNELDQLGETRSIRALQGLERERRAGFTDRLWAGLYIQWTQTPISHVTLGLGRWLRDNGDKVLSNIEVVPEDVQSFTALAQEHFARSATTRQSPGNPGLVRFEPEPRLAPETRMGAEPKNRSAGSD